MLLVKTKIGASAIQGTGLFADEFIPQGTLIWKFQPGFDIKVTQQELDQLSQPSKEQFLKYCYHNQRTGKYVLCFDDGRFINHADSPNCIEGSLQDGEEAYDVASRDINPGEELTCNYSDFDADFNYKMSIR